MVVLAALGAALRIATRPHRDVHGVFGRFVRDADGERMTGEQVTQAFGVDPSPPEHGVEAAPAATMRRLQAQVDGGRDGGLRGEDGVGEFEEGVTPAAEAFVERAAEGAESIGRFHDAPIMRSATALRTSCLPVKLKRKLKVDSRKSARMVPK